MKYIISGTNRPDSRSMAVSQIILKAYTQHDPNWEIIDLCQLPFNEMDGSHLGQEGNPPLIETMVKKISASEALCLVVPEYNGSYPGALKYFIDHWEYPQSFEFRPTAFVGIGGRFGGMRPVEHLQQVFGYRNAYMFPERLFITNIWSELEGGQLKTPLINELLENQASRFHRFIEALQKAGLAAGSAQSS